MAQSSAVSCSELHFTKQKYPNYFVPSIAPFLGVPPGFLISGKSPLLLAVTQVVIELLPSVPEFSLQLELPLSFLDALTRTLLLVHAIPSIVLKSPFTDAAQSPWTLLLTSFVCLLYLSSDYY
jgi:hypothetical protein